MKDQDFRKMTEDQLFEFHFEASQEIADITRAIIDMKRRILNLSRDLDILDLELESRQAQDLKKENKLN